MSVPGEEKRRSLDGLSCSSESSEEKFETIGVMQEDNIEIIVGRIKCVDILIENHISLFFWHVVEMFREGMNTMNTETLFIDKNLFGMSRFRQEMYLHLVFEPFPRVAKFLVVVIHIANNGKMSESFESMKEFFCYQDKVLK
jgi:hypothetical protein